jgi:hypothetical protein
VSSDGRDLSGTGAPLLKCSTSHAPRSGTSLAGERARVRELILFDPDGAKGERVRWQVFRRRQGKLQLVQATHDDRVRSGVLRCWLRATGEGADLRVRLATGARGDDLVEAVDEENARPRAEIARLKKRRA